MAKHQPIIATLRHIIATFFIDTAKSDGYSLEL